MIKRLAKAALRKIIADCELWTIYQAPDKFPEPAGRDDVRFAPVDDRQVILNAPSEIIRGMAGFAGAEAAGFGAWVDGCLVSLCWFWWGERYRGSILVWPLAERAANLVQISTDEGFRSRQIAASLIQYATFRMQQQGAGTLHARIWHSNVPSAKAFRNAGWTPTAFVARIARSPKRYYRLIVQWNPKFRVTLSFQARKGK
jgi:ribosomal protein S18 acetylase RimI-like enzyme